MEYEFVDKVPPKEFYKKPSELTRDILSLIRKLEPGQTLKLAVSGNHPMKEVRAKNQLYWGRARSAAKISGLNVRVHSRKYDIFVTRLPDDPEEAKTFARGYCDVVKQY